MSLWLALACAPGSAVPPAPVATVAVSAPVAVPLTLTHDLFTGGTAGAQQFQMVEWADLAAAWPVPLDLRRAPDALAVEGELRIPVGLTGQTVYLVTAGYGGVASRGVAAEGSVCFAGGECQPFRTLVGEGSWPAWAGATARSADALGLGRNAGGSVLSAAIQAIVLAETREVTELVIRPRGGLSLFLLGLAVDAAGPVAPRGRADERPPEGYPFALPLVRADPAPARRPADRAVVVDGEDLRFEGGGAARFWGVNLVGRSALPEKERAEAVAAGLAARGFDLVRPHHIDTVETLLNPRRLEAGEGLVQPEAIDRFDRLFAALKAKGIYSFVEMWTRRAFVAGEGVPGPDGLIVGNKYVGYIWPEWREAQKAWFRAVWGRTNPYTGLRYADDPAVAFVELSNENSLITGWSVGSLEKLPSVHRREFDRQWNAWLRRRYGNDGAIAAAWSGSGRPGLEPGETLVIESIAREPAQRGRTELYPTRRAVDLLAFYAELERAYYTEMQEFVRGEMGFSAPTICSTAMGVPHADRQLAACDVIDLHPYWDPIGESTAFYDRSLLRDSDRWFERHAVCQRGKPCTISEVQHSFPNRYAQEAPLLWAALAGRQGIDAVLWFAWSHDNVRDLADAPAGALDLEGRLGADVQMAAAGEVYRRVQPAAQAFTRWWSPGGLERDLAETGGLWIPETVGLDSWLQRRVQVDYGDGPPPPAPPAPAPNDRVSWSPGRLVVEGSDFAAVVGSAMATAENPDPAALAANVDGHVALSLVRFPAGSWLYTAAGRTDRVGSVGTRGVPGLLVLGGGPALLERLVGHVRLPGLRRAAAQVLDPAGAAMRPALPSGPRGDIWALPPDSPWLLLTPQSPP